MLIAITASIIPLILIGERIVFKYIEVITVIIFIVDYALRWITSDLKFGKKGWSFIIYPFTPMAIIDLLSILPGLSILSPGFKIFRVTRLFKIFRIFKFLRYSDKFEILWRVIKKEKATFFKAVLTRDGESYQAVALILENSSASQSYTKCCLSVNELEDIIDIDLFPALDDSIEEAVESTFSKRFWGM